MSVRPIRVTVRDPSLERSRLTVGFRLILALPHIIWLSVWLSLASVVAIANWIATLITTRPSPMLARFLGAYARYATHVSAYLTFAADPYPAFNGHYGRYPIDLEIEPSGPQNRWTTGFRLVLAFPAILLADSMLGVGTSFAGGASTQLGGIAVTVAFFAYFACLAQGRMPRGFRDLLVYTIGYTAQVTGYVFLLTDRYPDSDPEVSEAASADPDHPIRLTVDDDRRRSRLTVFFRVLLALPHFIWLLAWGIAVFFSAIVAWFAALFTGQVPDWAHRFFASFIRYQTHVYAFVLLVANPFPGFAGRPGSYPVDVEIPGHERQSKVITGFRLILAIPALALGSSIGGTAFIAAVLGWFPSLFTGEMPKGLRNLGAFSLRYQAQTFAYGLLVTERYPYSGPGVSRQLSIPAAALEPS